MFSQVEKSPKIINTNKKVLVEITVSSLDLKIEGIYDSLNYNDCKAPSLECFKEALKGYYSLKEKALVEKDIITLIDFSLSSNEKRLWIIDLNSNTILYNSLVAHGKNSGEEFANSFSNNYSSYKSSLGLYLTGEIYNGKHGLSLKLDGLERGINDHTRERGVVIHSADYVSFDFINQHKRLGRSQGCPVIPQKLLTEIIYKIKNKSCLFIYHPSRTFETNYPSYS